MNYSKRQLYALGEPLGDAATTHKPFGRVYGGGGGSGGSSKSSSAIVYPDEIKPLLSNVANLSTDLYNQPWAGFTGQRYEDLNGTQQQALQMMSDRAANGSELWNTAQSGLTAMMGDQTNPHLDQQVANAQKSVVDSYNLGAKPQMEAAMANSGSFGNSGLQQMQAQQQNQLQQNLGNVATEMYGNAYNTNQANKLSALGMAQNFANQDYTDAGQLLQAGDAYQDQGQLNKDFAYEQYLAQQDDPYKKLQAMTGVMQGTAGSSTTTKQSGGGK